MPLTHVCVWDGKIGYRRVSVEEACSMYPSSVAANRGIFVCSLCAQNVGLTASGANARHFRHTSASQKKECEDRAQAYARISMGYNCHPMPLRIKVNQGSYLLELGFFLAPSSITGGPRCQKIIITGDNGQEYVHSFERLLSEGITYLNVGNIPSANYRLSYNNPSPNLGRYWPSKTIGIDSKGSFFDCTSGKMLHPGGKAYPHQEYYLLQRRSIVYFPDGISCESIAQTKTGSFTTWYLYKIYVRDFSKSVARFFLERSIFLTEKPVAFYPIWPLYVEDPYFLYHNDPKMYFFMQGEDAELNIYPATMYTQCEHLKNGKLYKLYAASKEQLLSLGQSGMIGFSYLMTKTLDMVAQSPEVQIRNIDGKLIVECICNQLPKGRKITIQAPFDGKVVILKNNKTLEIRHISAEQIITIAELAFGYEIQVFQSCDLIRTTKFERPQQNINELDTDRLLFERLRNCKSNRIPIPHSVAAVISQLKTYTLTKQWLLSQLRLGSIDRNAYLELVCAVNQKERVKADE